nr:MAG TPA: hypothetical protein [Caudoviricetes sp.]
MKLRAIISFTFSHCYKYSLCKYKSFFLYKIIILKILELKVVDYGVSR